MVIPAALACVLLGFAPSVHAEGGFATSLISVAYITEKDPDGVRLEGVKLGPVLYYDDHAPPMTGFLSLEYLSGSGREQGRLAGSFSILEFPGGKAYSVWIRPVIGLQYRSSPLEDEFDGFAGIGGELILRPHSKIQVAATYDRIFTFSGDATSQYGIALRYGFGD